MMRMMIALILAVMTSVSVASEPTKPVMGAKGPIEVCLSTCVRLAEPALRVVALNWSAAEMLLSLGVEPIGVTEAKGYRKWQTNHPELPSSVVEVGRRQEPNLTAIAKLKPDLIIGYDFRHQGLYPMLSRIAPTLLYQQFPNIDQDDFRYFDYSQVVFKQLAVATRQQEKAAQLLFTMKQGLSDLRKQLIDAGLENSSVTYGKFVGMGYGLRIFSKRSLAGSVAQQLGLNYRWHSRLPGKDFVHLQLEQLPELDDTHLLLAGNQTDSERMTSSPVWPHLPFVKHGRFSEVPPLWSFGGPVSIQRMAEAFIHSLLTWQGEQHG
ncbi:iron-siderophore ABC transporter substrate-binding protein [Shewanella sp. VB17]|uniref:ABC transporter substrate-binding protein n=1 Tax=Shewanella sp. VB17 TaxID=2739432 RepID=UPI0015637136|nr:iron-siderophore ABC transporter substrate-binding protein [Shewanella sp. VB17]NRD75335.1 iron-siderophore ABC transporter substrate-binding protein [Shewanella sp. VB17]